MKKTRLEELEEQILVLQKEKEKELLRIEVEKLKKTKIEEEIIIKKRIIQNDPYKPWYVGGYVGGNIVLCSNGTSYCSTDGKHILTATPTV